MRKPRASRGRRKNKIPNKKELAVVGALDKAGLTPYAIEQRTGLNHHTVKKYLTECAEVFEEPEMKSLMTRYMEQEISDLSVLTVKARQRLHDIVERMNPIEALALMDRSFQQRRLLEGKSTQNISTLARIIREANKDLADDGDEDRRKENDKLESAQVVEDA